MNIHKVWIRVFMINIMACLTRSQNRSLSGCRTADLSEMCVFPFVYKNIVYSTCTTVDTSNNKAWCATHPAKPGDTVALHIAPHWADCEDQCQNSCSRSEDCSKNSFCHYDMYCQAELCSNTPDKCGPGRYCKAQDWCEKLYGFDRCPRECVCNSDCPSEYKPICGSNEMTYLNECLMRLDACTKDEEIISQHNGACRVCNKDCTSENQQICGSNNKTYLNICELERESCETNLDIVFDYAGECKAFMMEEDTIDQQESLEFENTTETPIDIDDYFNDLTADIEVLSYIENSNNSEDENEVNDEDANDRLLENTTTDPENANKELNAFLSFKKIENELNHREPLLSVTDKNGNQNLDTTSKEDADPLTIWTDITEATNAFDNVEVHVTEETQDLPIIQENDSIDMTEPSLDEENDEELSSNHRFLPLNEQTSSFGSDLDYKPGKEDIKTTTTEPRKDGFVHFNESPLPLGLEDRLLAIIEKDSQNTTKRTIQEKHDVTTIHEETPTTPAGVIETTLSSEQK